MLQDEILQRVTDLRRRIGNSRQASALPLECDLCHAQGTQMELGHFRFEEFDQGWPQRKPMVTAEPDTGIKQDFHRRLARKQVRRDQFLSAIEDRIFSLILFSNKLRIYWLTGDDNDHPSPTTPPPNRP